MYRRQYVNRYPFVFCIIMAISRHKEVGSRTCLLLANDLALRVVHITPVAEAGFSHILTPYKIVGHFFGRSKSCLVLDLTLTNQVESSFFLTLQLHARMLTSEVTLSSKRYDIFHTLGSGSLSVAAMLIFG